MIRSRPLRKIEDERVIFQWEVFANGFGEKGDRSDLDIAMIILESDSLEHKTMAESVTLNLPDQLVQQVYEVAILTQRNREEILLEWIDRGRTGESAIASLSNEQILNLCDLQMSEPDQIQMSLLLGQQREGLLQKGELEELDRLLQIYRRGMVKKSEALKIAVERGLRDRLG